MKLLQALRQQIAAEQTKVANLFAKQVGFNSIHDSSTVIEREHAKHAWKWLVQNKQLLLDSFPKENVKKLIMLDTIDANTDLGEVLIIFKQILRSQKARLISRKRYDWNVEQRRQSYTLEYRIISATPDPPHTRPTPTRPTPQTNKTTESNTETSDIKISDVKVSSDIEEIPQAVTMSAKRKLSPTPEHVEQPVAKKPHTLGHEEPQSKEIINQVLDIKVSSTDEQADQQQQPIPNQNVSDVKVLHTSPIITNPSPTPIDAQSPTQNNTKPDTPHKQQQPTPNTQVSDVSVLDASPLITQPNHSPLLSPTDAVSPKALTPTFEGGVEREQVPVDLPAI